MSVSESVERLEPRPEAPLRGPALADRTGLEVVGFIFAGVTAAVIAVAALTVRHHVVARNSVEPGAAATSPVAPARR